MKITIDKSRWRVTEVNSVTDKESKKVSYKNIFFFNFYDKTSNISKILQLIKRLDCIPRTILQKKYKFKKNAFQLSRKIYNQQLLQSKTTFIKPHS